MEKRKYEVSPINEEEWEEFSKTNATRNLRFGTSFFVPKCWSIMATYYTNKKNSRYWSHIKIDIYKDGELWFTFYRNYSAIPPFGYLVQNGKEYLVTSSNYQCITVINLTDKKMESYCLGNFEYGGGFCPTDIYVDTCYDSIDIKIEGCYWGGDYGYFILEDVNMEHFEIPEDTEIFYDD